MKQIKHYFILLLMLLILPAAYAESPVGTWISMDDKTGQQRAEVNISMTEGELNGIVVKIFPQPGDTGICTKCPDEFKDKPIEGLRIIWGLREQHHGTWGGGYILDPKEGKVYRARLSVKGNKLYVRGYIGVSLLGRTQIWVRQ